MRFVHASISISACSATACEFDPGAWTTATPRRVAAGMSTLSRPTPWRPTTLSRLHASMREAEERGRPRNRMPWASAAVLIIPSSVGSSVTITRHSRSRMATASLWSGALTTTRGRGSVGMEASPFGGRRTLLARDEDQARRVERERCAVERTVDVHLAPPLGTEHGAQLVGGVQTDLGFAHQLAGVRVRGFVGQAPPASQPPARGRIEAVLDAKRAVVHRQPLLGRHGPDRMVAVARVENEEPARLESTPEAVDEHPVLVVGKVADAGEEVHSQIELPREFHVAHVLAHEAQRDVRVLGGGARPLDLGLVEVHAGDGVAAARELHGVPPEAAGRVEHGRAPLAAWQVPLCRQDPSRGALINVVGTANVFEAARAGGSQVERIVYASSAAVFGPPDLYPPGPVKDEAPPRPATHYGVYKVANEETARVYWDEHKIPSMGFRPLSVYGPGPDFGLTAHPTLRMKAAVLGRSFKIRWGGRTDLVFTEDVARALLAAARSRHDGARVYNLHGASAAIADLVRLIDAAWPSAKGLLSHVEQPIPFPEALDAARYQKHLGPAAATPLEAGVRRTLAEFA